MDITYTNCELCGDPWAGVPLPMSGDDYGNRPRRHCPRHGKYGITEEAAMSLAGQGECVRERFGCRVIAIQKEGKLPEVVYDRGRMKVQCRNAS